MKFKSEKVYKPLGGDYLQKDIMQDTRKPSSRARIIFILNHFPPVAFPEV